MNLKVLVLKLIKKLKILPYVNCVVTFSINQHEIKIPILKSLGYPNVFLEPNWLFPLIEKFCTDDETFVDVGVNIGQTLIALKSTNKHISYIGFEPNISCLFYVEELISLNNFQNCQIFGVALSDKFQTLQIGKNEATDASASVVKNLRLNYFKQEDAILGVDFDSLGIKSNISFIKIDVEGAELEVLLGMSMMLKKDRPIMTCEVLDSFSIEVLEFTQERANKVFDFLKNVDYSVVQLEQNTLHNKILTFKTVEHISIKQWTNESYRFNDYLFVPSEKLSNTLHTLQTICF